MTLPITMNLQVARGDFSGISSWTLVASCSCDESGMTVETVDPWNMCRSEW